MKAAFKVVQALSIALQQKAAEAVFLLMKIPKGAAKADMTDVRQLEGAECYERSTSETEKHATFQQLTTPTTKPREKATGQRGIQLRSEPQLPADTGLPNQPATEFALPGPDERRRILEKAQRAVMQARKLMECLHLLEHDPNWVFKLAYVEDGGGSGFAAVLTRYLAVTEQRVRMQRELGEL